jgi:class 3 adenylate cyclase
MVTTLDPGVIVSELNDIYSAFDRIGEQFRCERIKTNGDDYIAVSGMPDPSPEHARSVANAAVRFVRYLARRNSTHPVQWQCRIALASGAVIGSVVGVQKYVYDVFGPAVSDSLRLRAHAEPMTVLASSAVAETLGERLKLTSVEWGERVGGDVFRVDMAADSAAARAG